MNNPLPDDTTFRTTCDGIDFAEVPVLLKSAGMAHREPEQHRKAFQNSARVLFVFQGATLIGCGRAISDETYQAALYDIAVSPEHQGKHLGRAIVERLIEGMDGYNIILYATPGKEDFYRKFGFKRLQTGMGRFIYAARMTERGFTD